MDRRWLAPLLALAVSGCIAAQADAPDAQAPAGAEAHAAAGAHGRTPTIAEATDDGTPADEPLRVSWFPEAPRPGDTVRVVIETAVRWPAPTCHVEQHVAEPLGGGSSSVAPASESGDAYACAIPVGVDTVALVVLVTRPHGDLLRIHGPHAIDVATPEPPRREAFARFALDATADGLPRVRGELPPSLVNVGVPQVGPAYGSNTTQASVSLHVFPRGHGLSAAFGEHVAWTTPLAFENVVDVPASLRAIEEEFSADYPERDYVLVAHAFARGDLAYASSAPRVLGFGACAPVACHVIDG